MTSPLDGIRVIEVGNYIAGPYCGTQLADLGAEVIKIENPHGGDAMRSSFPQLGGDGSAFLRLNRNKESLAINLKNDSGKEVFRDLARHSDVIIENLRPGTMDKLGLGYHSLEKENEALIYYNASGWGRDGPLSSQGGLDIMAQARSGLMSITGQPGDEPAKVGVPICDIGCALYGTIAVLAALMERTTTGLGQLVDVSLYETGVSFAIWEAGSYFSTGEIPKRRGSVHQAEAPYQAIRAENGWFVIGAATQGTWTALCESLGLEKLISDSRFIENEARMKNREELIDLIESVTSLSPIAHWLDVLANAGVPVAPINDYEQVFNDETLIERNFFWDAPHPDHGSVRQIGSPMQFSRTPTRRDSTGPSLGQHTYQILEQAGYSKEHLKRLVDDGAIAL